MLYNSRAQTAFDVKSYATAASATHVARARNRAQSIPGHDWSTRLFTFAPRSSTWHQRQWPSAPPSDAAPPSAAHQQSASPIQVKSQCLPRWMMMQSWLYLGDA
ncbi:uncharacterized protein LOC128202192 [Galleria mellonella]|uniref:Uncharacterized protein LOC128202192 n=1 Tax=Galleria mellonella TaxID=7137 RepID=A0ABM3N1P7_GALME|nr:uncharacterized protein LOC128202192 [Galleria mellonella]